MVISLLFALLIVVMVATTAYRRPSPWFWVAFPVTCLSIGFLLHRFVPLTPLSSLDGAAVIYEIAPGVPWLTISAAVAAVLGALASVWTWRRGSVEG
ncbi:hypothetical protein [Corynebacterium nasicanis]|uniref:Uncharacterized protein n=1 Tax=Corynebacterium nasicanis TaxID=1448267 RepID=A0ABW1QC28_9CORY